MILNKIKQKQKRADKITNRQNEADKRIAEKIRKDFVENEISLKKEEKERIQEMERKRL